MDIAPLSMAISQPKAQQHAVIANMRTTIDTGKENVNEMGKDIYNDAVQPNLGQNLDVIADEQMDKKEELHKQLQREMKWAQEKQKMLGVKETKMLQM